VLKFVSFVKILLRFFKFNAIFLATGWILVLSSGKERRSEEFRLVLGLSCCGGFHALTWLCILRYGSLFNLRFSLSSISSPSIYLSCLFLAIFRLIQKVVYRVDVRRKNSNLIHFLSFFGLSGDPLFLFFFLKYLCGWIFISMRWNIVFSCQFTV
jgi:hypothetical protein